MKVLKGSVLISRCTSNSEDPYIQIEIMDRSSGTTFVQAKLSLQAFAMAITSSESPAEIKVRGLEQIGKVRETMQVEIQLPPVSRENRHLAITEAIEPYVREGWICNKNDFDNHLKWVTGLIHLIRFHRFVEPPEK